MRKDRSGQRRFWRNARHFLAAKSPPVRRRRRLALESLENRELLAGEAINIAMSLSGTPGDDTFEFSPGEEEGTWRVTLNGEMTEYRAASINLSFSGGEGRDSARLAGSPDADTVELGPGWGSLASGSCMVTLSGVEVISVDGGGGDDRASLRDGPGDDVLTAGRGAARLSGDGFDNTVSSILNVWAYAKAGGKDTAYLHDSPEGRERFSSGSGWGKMLGDDWGIRTYSFQRVYAYATPGGGDAATLNDTPGSRDKVVITPKVTKFNGCGGARRLFGFSSIRVNATPEDNDLAKIYDDPKAEETLTADLSQAVLSGGKQIVDVRGASDVRVYSTPESGDQAVLQGNPEKSNVCAMSPELVKIASRGQKVQAHAFQQAAAHAGASGQDQVTFYGDPDKPDVFTASRGLARLRGKGYDLRAEGFRDAFAYGGKGDKARLHADPLEKEYFEADPKVGILRGEDYQLYVRNFTHVNAYATPGSDDTAVMYAAANSFDKFTGTPEASAMEGAGYVRKAVGFRYVHAYADPEDQDLAELSGGAGDDVFVATSEYGKLSGEGYQIRAVAFHEVVADSSSGNDEAFLYDSDGVDHIQAYPSLAGISHEGVPRSFSYVATGFDRVGLYSSNDDDIKDVAPGAAEWIASKPEAASVEQTGEAIERPNVLFIAIDDLNDWIGPLGGYPGVKTPNLDRLAARATTFSQAYCPAPLCNPSRTGLLTGYYPTSSGIYKNHEDWRVALPEAVTLPELFKQNGYHTVGGGKIFHWNDRTLWHEYFPSVVESGPGADVQQDDDNSAGAMSWGAIDGPDEEMNDYRVTSWAADYLRQEHESPFFLACGIFRPHLPWNVPASYFEQYPLEEIVLPEVLPDDLDDVPAAGQFLADPGGFHAAILNSGNWAKAVQAYLACISFVDAQVGRLLDALDASPHADNTVIALWSDHGIHLGEKEHWHKSTLWEESGRAPLMIAAPGVTEGGSVCETPIDLVNTYPTLADLCGLPIASELDGVSLRPLLEDPEAAWDRPALTNFRDANAVRYGQWRYIRYGDGSEELYDHQADPNEWTNLAGDPACQAIKAQLAAMLPANAALEAPKRVYSPLHWAAAETEAATSPAASGQCVFYTPFDRAAGRELWAIGGQSSPVLVADIQPGEGSSSPAQLVDGDGTLFFTANDGVHGTELWRSDGTESGTWLVKDIRGGAESSAIHDLIFAGGRLFFSADDGVHGSELWSSDGTEEGTVMVRDILPGPQGSHPTGLTAAGADLFFRAYHPDYGAELWKSDGTEEGTALVADILPGMGSSIPEELTAATGGGVFFAASDGIHGRELWYTAGDEESTRMVLDILPGTAGSEPGQLVAAGDLVFFVAGDGVAGRELWRSDGTEAGTCLVADIAAGPGSAQISELAAIGSRVAFRAVEPASGSEPWVSDGTPEGTRMILDVRPGSGGSSPAGFTLAGNTLYFTADDGLFGREPWVAGANLDGAALAADIYPGTGTSDPRSPVVLGETLFVFATDGLAGYRLWRIDGAGARPAAGPTSPAE